jgi:oxalate decarboxylase/phosphoglucose isomerase-like protein (cupin superfamily)
MESGKREIYTFEPGGLNQLHLHPNSDEVVLCIEGEGEIVVAEERNPIRVKDTVLVSVDRQHGFVNSSDKRMIKVVMECQTPVEHVPVEEGLL